MHRFRDTATYWLKIGEKPTPSSGTFLWDDLLRIPSLQLGTVTLALWLLVSRVCHVSRVRPGRRAASGCGMRSTGLRTPTEPRPTEPRSGD